MRKSLCRMQYALTALSVLALTACSGGSGSSTAPTAKLTANLVMPAAKTVALQADVTKTRLIVTGPSIPTAKADFANNTGGTIECYPGSDIIISAQAFNAGNEMVYEGMVTGKTIVAGDNGTVTIQLNAPVIKAEDTNCLSCHESTRSATDQNLVADYKQSGHYTNTSWTANAKNGSTLPGCAGCHGTGHNDTNPSASGRCYECHEANLTAKHKAAGVPLTNARYLNAGNNNCSACHEPHNPINGAGKQERKDWAASGHGDINALAWMDYDFSTRATCAACHTPAGFIKAINTSWADTTAPGGAMQPLTCDGCHTSDNFKNSVRTVGAYTAGMGGYGTAAVASMTFADVGESNLCIPCHASRENGASLKKTITNFGNSSFKNPHYLGAAAVFYGKGGFRFYSSASQTPYIAQAYNTEYGVVADGTIIKAAAASTSNGTPAINVGDVMVGEKAPWSHGKLGMNNFQTTKNAAVVAEKGDLVYSGTKGQCVSCHLGTENTHSFDAYKVADATWTANYKGCYGCHTSEDIREVAELEEKPLFDQSMAFFKWQLAQAGAVYSEAYPYFYKADGVTQLKNWNALDTISGMYVANGNGASNMGAAMNYKLLSAEKGAHVHNRTYMKQLIHDSIQYLQTGTVTYSQRYITAGSTADPNGLINFSNYSTYLAPTGTAGATVQAVRGYIVRKNTGSSGAIGSVATPLYTRP